MTEFWSLWIIVLTIITLVLLVWLLFGNRKRTQESVERTTGHSYDGIEEYDNPLPSWWFNMFVITIVWGVAYLIAYPGMGNFKGLLGWTQIEQYESRVAEAESRFRAERDRYLSMTVEEIADDPAVRKMGMRMFGNNCAQCHGSDARGSYGFPNLTDDDWLYGGDPATIKATLVNGRQAVMPSWGAILDDQEILETTEYVLQLSDRDVDAALAQKGKVHFNTYCVACHTAEGTGNPMLGAPDLTNDIWLYGGTRTQIAHTLRAGRNGQMPAFKDTLSEDKIHILTAYVYGLSN
tara:strand:- start:14583 stop:15461 length:879 start_codon:yes stop_codon:yes gene_type:complete